MSFWGELKRRNVFKVGAAYVIVAWLIVQVANTFFPILNLPAWAVTLVAVLVILGFPLALLFAWAFELTSEGLKKTEHVPLEESITHITGHKLNYILVGVIVLAVAYILIDNYYLDPRFIETELSTRVAELVPHAVEEEKASARTIAVLPFSDLSPDKDQEYFVDGLSEELLNCLAKIPDLSVTSRTSAFSFKDKDKTVQEIANVLGVAHILEGSVRKAGNTIRVTAQLIRASDDRHLWSNQYDRELKDIENILSIQGDIAKNVAHELKVTLGVEESLKQVGGTDNVEAYGLYLLATGQRNDGTCNASNLALEAIDKALALDPDYALAWALKSSIHSSNVKCVKKDLVALEQDTALSAAQRAIELEPNLVSGYYALSYAKLSMCELIETEYAYRKAIKLEIESSWSNETSGVPLHYFLVGYNKSAKGIVETLRQNDPLNPIISHMYITVLVALDDIHGAEEEIKRGTPLFGDQWMGRSSKDLMNDVHLFTNADIIIPDELSSDPIWSIVVKYLDSPKVVLEELHRFYNSDGNLNVSSLTKISSIAAYFDDPEFALAAIEKLAVLDLSQLNLWYPVMHDTRQLPRFKEFVREIGLVDYWEQFGWPDLCKPTGDGDFVCE